jgi:tetratricopeptide (TPR) repeat protein
MTFVEQFLSRLQATEGDVHAQAAVAAEFVLLARPEAEREALRATLDAAAVLRWFDGVLLAAVLGISEIEAQRRYEVFITFPFVERQRRAEKEVHSVHEATRLGWRKMLAKNQGERFRVFATNAASYFASDFTATGRIEWIYHRLCAAPEKAAAELEYLERGWSGCVRPEDRQALAASLSELLETDLVSGHAQLWAMLSIAWARGTRGESAKLRATAEHILKMSRDLHDENAESDAQGLLVDVFGDLGFFAKVQEASNEFLRISKNLVEKNPKSVDLQRELVMAYIKAGDVLQTQGKLVEAQDAYGHSLRIITGLVEQDVGKSVWQRDLATAQNRMGDVLQDRGKLAHAYAAYDQSLKTIQQLVEKDSGNMAWQHDLSSAYGKIGDVLRTQGRLVESQEAYEHHLQISQKLVEQDQGNVGFIRTLAVAYSKLGDVLQSQVLVARSSDKMMSAQKAYAQGMQIMYQIFQQDPSNTDLQRGFAVILSKMGDVLLKQHKLNEALETYKQSLRVSQELARQASGNYVWQRDLAVAYSKIGDVLNAQDKPAEARAAYNQALQLSRRLARHDKVNILWQRDLAQLMIRMADVAFSDREAQKKIVLLRESLGIYDTLVKLGPDNAVWRDERENVVNQIKLQQFMP